MHVTPQMYLIWINFKILTSRSWSCEPYQYGREKEEVSWFKRPGDSKLPIKELLKERYEQTKSRREDDRAYLKPGEAAIIDAIDEHNGGGEGEGEGAAN